MSSIHDDDDDDDDDDEMMASLFTTRLHSSSCVIIDKTNRNNISFRTIIYNNLPVTLTYLQAVSRRMHEAKQITKKANTLASPSY